MRYRSAVNFVVIALAALAAALYDLQFSLDRDVLLGEPFVDVNCLGLHGDFSCFRHGSRGALASRLPNHRDRVRTPAGRGAPPEMGSSPSGNIEIHTGNTKDARRAIPASPAVEECSRAGGHRPRPGHGSGHFSLRVEVSGEWVFPAPTKTGHITADSLKRQHADAIEDSEVKPFVLYPLRHTCLTRWATLQDMDLFTLKKLAGHARIETTNRYVHVNDTRPRKILEKVWKKALTGHKFGHTDQNGGVVSFSFEAGIWNKAGGLKMVSAVGIEPTTY